MLLEGTGEVAVREGRGQLLGSLAHALGLPKQRTVTRSSAIRAADTDGTGEPSLGADAAGVSPV